MYANNELDLKISKYFILSLSKEDRTFIVFCVFFFSYLRKLFYNHNRLLK